ncbi:MAG: S1/P1 nuclease [Pseudohongiella sp.]|nr:S1/P1 nuclease [Pseudohongiella sp.]
MFLYCQKLKLASAMFAGLVASLMATGVTAWDATGHRLTAYVAWEFMSEQSKERTLTILRSHPRFDRDFLNAMPDNVRATDMRQQDRWLFGQAAIWPDLARSFSGADSRRYDHPEWHWVDGAWVRDEATRQGNLYVNTEAFADIEGIPAERVQRRSQAENVVTAIDLAVYEMSHARDPAEQALALSWFLHLTGDIHQPLHTGGLVSARMFSDGDRGGNGIRVRSGSTGSNLHAVWDGALRGPTLETSLRMLIDIAGDIAANKQLAEYAPTRWLQESRDYLLSSVYPDTVISNVLRSENTGNQPGTITLSEAYEEQMRMIAAQRIAEAGVRIANTLGNL